MKQTKITETIRHRAFYAALAFFVLSLAFVGWRLYSGDAEAYFTVAFRLSLGQLPAISERLAGYGVRGTAGLLYAKFGLGFSLVLIPLVWTTMVIASLSGSVLTGPVLYASSHLIGPILGGAGIYLFHTLQARLGMTRTARRAGTLMFLFGGLWLVYSRFLFSELFAGVLLLACVHGVLDRESSGDWLLAFAASFLFLVRGETVLITVPLVLVRWWKTGRTAPYLLVGGCTLFVFGWYNWLRFGRPFYTGMGHSRVESFSTPILLGFYGQFFAPGNGLFLYAPFLIPVFPVAGMILYRTGLWRSKYFLSLVLGSLAYLLLHSVWHSWMGGWSWGPRRMVPLLPLIHLSVGFSWSALSTGMKRLTWTLIPASLILNAGGLLGDFNEYYRGRFYSKDVLFDPDYAQVFRYNVGLLRGEFNLENVWIGLFGNQGGIFFAFILFVVTFVLLRKFYEVRLVDS